MWSRFRSSPLFILMLRVVRGAASLLLDGIHAPFCLPLTGADPNALGCEAGVLRTDESKVLRIEFVLSLFCCIPDPRRAA